MERGHVFAICVLVLVIILYLVRTLATIFTLPTQSYAPYFIFFAVNVVFVILLPEEKVIFGIPNIK